MGDTIKVGVDRNLVEDLCILLEERLAAADMEEHSERNFDEIVALARQKN